MEGHVDGALLLGTCTPVLSAKDRRRAWSQQASEVSCKGLAPRVMGRWVLPVWKRQARAQVCACTSLRPVASLPSVLLTALLGDQGVDS